MLADKARLPHRVLLLFALLLLAWGCLQGPPLRTEPTIGGVIIHFETLGEYPTTLRRITLTDAGGAVVWEIRANSGCRQDAPQLWKLTLKEGENKASPDGCLYGTYDVLVPAGADSFVLRAGRPYTLRAWGRGERASSLVQLSIAQAVEIPQPLSHP